MTKEKKLKPEQATILKDLEKLVGKPIPLVEDVSWDTFGVKIDSENIVGLGLHGCGIATFPETITNLTSLRFLNLRDNKLSVLPESIGKLSSLKELYLYENQLRELPDSFGNLTSLTKLRLYNNILSDLPESLINLKSLKALYLGSNKLNVIPESILKLKSLTSLDLSYNSLTSIPEAIGDMVSLKDLWLRHNQLRTLPESITNLKNLQELSLGGNQFETLPNAIGDLTSLEKLYLYENQLTTIPKSIGNLKSLQVLNVENNALSTLPESLGNLSSLKELRLKKNKLSALPTSLWQLKNLKLIELGGNSWKSEWKEIIYRDIPAILKFCKQRASINVFISHVVNEFEKYKIKELSDFLESQEEINQAFFCEEDLKGNIDKWMEEKVPECQLLLFFGTQQSLLSRDCTIERLHARQNKIPIIPIKGIDVNWEDLASIGLSRELGFEFEEKDFNGFCNDVYAYICEFKREQDLISKQQEKIANSISDTINIFSKNL